MVKELGVGSDEEMQRSVGRIEGKLDALNLLMSSYNLQFLAHTADDVKAFLEVKRSMSSLSKQVYYTAGAFGVISGLVIYLVKTGLN